MTFRRTHDGTRSGAVWYGVVATAGGVPVEVTVAFPTPRDADLWARERRGGETHHVAPIRFITGPPAR